MVSSQANFMNGPAGSLLSADCWLPRKIAIQGKGSIPLPWIGIVYRKQSEEALFPVVANKPLGAGRDPPSRSAGRSRDADQEQRVGAGSRDARDSACKTGIAMHV